MVAARLGAALVTMAGFLGYSGDAAAHSLRSNLHRFISNVTTPIAADVVEPISPIVQRVAVRGIDFPVTSTTPGFTYRYNLDLGMFERSSRSLGPEFLERAETVGRGRVDLGLSYLYADLTDEDGDNFAERIFLGSQVTVGGVGVAGVFRGTDFSLETHVFSPFVTYGVTDRWDVNLIVPLVHTTLELEGVAAAGIQGQAVGVGRFRLSDFFDNEAFGVGDLQLRTKYRFLEGGPLDMAGAFALRLPTGEEDDFQGLGDVMLTPSVIASRAIGPHQVHAQLGVEVNSDDLERSRARYGVGGELQPLERFALVLEILGSSSFVDDEFTIPKSGGIVPNFTLLPNDFVEQNRPTDLVAAVPRSDVVDLAFGLKANVAGTVVAYAGAIWPLTDDSLRGDVTLAGGVEVSF
jgi:hypothetical protein